MTPGARQAAIIELYDMILAQAKPADQVMQAYFRQRTFIGSKDRKFIAETLYTILRHFGHLSWWTKKLDLPATGRFMVLLALVLGQRMPFDEVNDLFDGAGYNPKPLSGSEINVLKAIADDDFEPDDMPQSIRLECPEWAYDGLLKTFGDDLEQELNALQTEAPLDLRVNILKGDREAVLGRLQDDGFDIEETPFSPIGMRVTGRPPFSAHQFYKDGTIEVQDEGSQILSLLCGARPGEWLVDFCAGAGGKTLALAAQMQNKGRIWGCDVEERRLENARKRLRRAGVHCVELQTLRDEKDDWVKKHAGKADCVLIDAPCSGVGTWRRNPFSRWQGLGPDLKTLTELQASIFDSASRLVKPGGRLIYATCSMLAQENADHVQPFLDKHSEFQPVALNTIWTDAPKELDLSGSTVQLTPFSHNTDGFFAAAFRRS